MEVRRIGDAILRSRSSPILSFLAPHVPAQLRYRYSSIIPALPSNGSLIAIPCSTRTFASSSVTRTDATPAAGPEQLSEIKSSPPDQSRSPSEIDSVMGGLVGSYKKPAFKSSTAQVHNHGNSGTDVRSAFDNAISESSRINRGTVNAHRMLDPLPEPSSQASITEQVRDELKEKPVPRYRMRLGPSVGRSVPIDTERGIDLGRGFRVLEMNCMRNSVRGDFMRQRFHERPGLKRKRLHSSRWRKRFKAGFRAVVAKVEDMRRRGW
ncbi:MAG: hypothetical protein M1830_007337 [Pleopsidium flavum]|nr:MAG: hypothetical protein M1830_007337 [Pleopsidium flavum]